MSLLDDQRVPDAIGRPLSPAGADTTRPLVQRNVREAQFPDMTGAAAAVGKQASQSPGEQTTAGTTSIRAPESSWPGVLYRQSVGPR